MTKRCPICFVTVESWYRLCLCPLAGNKRRRNGSFVGKAHTDFEQDTDHDTNKKPCSEDRMLES